MTFDLAQIISMWIISTLIGIIIGSFITFQVITNPKGVENWINTHAHFIAQFYNTEVLCPVQFNCTLKK